MTIGRVGRVGGTSENRSIGRIRGVGGFGRMGGSLTGESERNMAHGCICIFILCILYTILGQVLLHSVHDQVTSRMWSKRRSKSAIDTCP